MAGVKPETVQLKGIDPVAYIMAANEHRRHMNKGQRAMVAAKVRFLENRSTRQIAKESGAAQPMIAKASVVLEHAPDLVDVVIAGNMPLSKAYESGVESSRDSHLPNARRDSFFGKLREGKLEDL